MGYLGISITEGAAFPIWKQISLFFQLHTGENTNNNKRILTRLFLSAIEDIDMLSRRSDETD